MLDDADIARRQRASQRAFYSDVIVRVPRARLEDMGGGVVASVCPDLPHRSLVNAVLYEDGAELIDRLDALTAFYAGEGIVAWTVWTHAGDEVVAAALQAAGHSHDGRPMLMGAALAEMDLDRDDDLDLVAEPTWEQIGAINDAAYGIDGDFQRLLTASTAQAGRRWVARADGAPAACVATMRAGDDAYVGMVATHPAARGRGLCTRLMAHALRAERDAGCVSTTLEATLMGEPVYARLGYRSLGRMGMWERRAA